MGRKLIDAIQAGLDVPESNLPKIKKNKPLPRGFWPRDGPPKSPLEI